MSKYHKSSINLIVIVLIATLFWKYFLELEIGYGVISLIGVVGFTIYRNFEAAKEEKNKKSKLYRL